MKAEKNPRPDRKARGKHPSFLPEWPCGNVPLEWWYVHGHFEHGTHAGGHFMLVLFRYQVGQDYRHFLLFRLAGMAGDPPVVVSMLEEPVEELLRRTREEFAGSNLDETLYNTYLEEVEKHGLPGGVATTHAPAVYSADDFGIAWEGFSISCKDGRLLMGFPLPGAGRSGSLELQAMVPRVDLNMVVPKGEGPYAYLAYPACALQGSVGELEVVGTAWVDHQWGGSSHTLRQESRGGGKKVYGWEWMGISLDDGRSMVVGVHRDLESQQAAFARVALIDRVGQARAFETVVTEPTRFWRSPRTNITYPIGWRVEVPALQASLVFEAAEEDQEIPVMGIVRAIWQGAGRVGGTMEGRQVSGRARLEINGHGFVFRLSDMLDSLSQRVREHIGRFFPEVPGEEFFTRHTGLNPVQGNLQAVEDGLTRPMWDMLHRGGKVWRPMFGILLTQALGKDSDRYEDLFSVTSELIHLASLVIDDIEDEAMIRRNEPCVHLKYGVDVAINAANTLYFLPILKLRENRYVKPEAALQIYEKAMEFYVKAHFGQGLDIQKSRFTQNGDEWHHPSLIQDALNIYALKSASPLEFIAHAACILAETDPETRDVLVAFGREMGVSFQIKDDIHDFGCTEKWTKDPGSDLASGKLTYVILLALQNLPDGQARFIRDLLGKKIPASRKNVAAGLRIIRRSGALQKADAEVRLRMDKAWQALVQVIPQSDARILLKVVCDHLLRLDYAPFGITE